MQITRADRWRSDPRGEPEQVIAAFALWGAFPMKDVSDAVHELYRLGKRHRLDALLLVAHAALESGDRAKGGAFRDANWATVNEYRSPVNRYNGAGIGITPSDDYGYRFAGGHEFARAFFAHHARYEIPANDPAWSDPDLADAALTDPRFYAVAKQSIGTVETVADMNNKWWTNPNGADDLVRRGNDLLAVMRTLPANSGGNDMNQPAAFKYVTGIPGAKRALILPAHIPVEIRPVDLPRVRSYEKWNKSLTTVHDTANPRTNARGEYAWLAAGRPGGSVGGYEWINDDTVIIITGWFDETTWAQGVQSGNRKSHAGEIAFGGNIAWSDTLDVAMWMHAAVLEMDDIMGNDAAVLHQYWTGKWCAGQILNRGNWLSYVRPTIYQRRDILRAFRNGQPIEVPGVVYAPRSMPIIDGKPWDGREDVTINGVKFEAQRITATTTANLNQRQWASTDSAPVGPTIPAGTEITLLGWVAGELVDGVSEWWVDDKGGRLWAGGIDAEPKVDPEYGQEPEHATGLRVVNGRAYYRLAHEETGAQGRDITIHRDGELHRWADPASAVMGNLAAGDVVNCGWWTRGESLPLDTVDYDGNPVTVSENIWYVASNDLEAGNRFWSGLSTERPD